MFTAIISGSCAIIAALVTAAITMRSNLQSKRLELLGNSEERKEKNLSFGYNMAIAAADLCWHYNCHRALQYYRIEPPFDWDGEFINNRNHVQNLFSRAVDLLKENSLHYATIAPALDNLLRITWNAETMSGMESKPHDYEDARQLVIEMSRIDRRLARPVKKSFWKRFSEENQPADLHELSAEEKLRRASAMVKNREAETVILQDDALQAFIQSFQKEPPEFAESLARTAARVENWRDEDIITKETPCSRIAFPYYEEAQEKTAKRAENDD